MRLYCDVALESRRQRKKELPRTFIALGKNEKKRVYDGVFSFGLAWDWIGIGSHILFHPRQCTCGQQYFCFVQHWFHGMCAAGEFGWNAVGLNCLSLRGVLKSINTLAREKWGRKSETKKLNECMPSENTLWMNAESWDVDS